MQNQKNTIDFAIFSVSPKQSSTRRDALLAACIIGLIFLIMAVIAIFVKNSQKETAMAIIGIVGLCVFIGMVIRGIIIGFKSLSKQKQAFRIFAQQHNWSFDGKRKQASRDMVPTAWTNDRDRIIQRFIIDGHYQNIKFEFYELIVPGVRAASFMTILRKYSNTIRQNYKIADNLYYFHDDGYDFFVKNGNAKSREDIQEIFLAADLA